MKRNSRIPEDAKTTIPDSDVPIDLLAMHTPAHTTQYRIPHHKAKFVDDQIATWERQGTIQKAPGGSSWNAPIIVPTRTVNGVTKLRACLDVRGLNAQTKTYRRVFPAARDTLESITEAEIFSTVDLDSAFAQFKLVKAHREFTSFTWRNVRYIFLSCPFGLKNMPSFFQEQMEKLFANIG